MFAVFLSPLFYFVLKTCPARYSQIPSPPPLQLPSPHIICSHFSKSLCDGDFRMLTENQGSLFRAMETPEPPSKGFFSSLFSSAASPLDREQLCKYWTSKQTKLCVYSAQWVTSEFSWKLCSSRNLFIPGQGKIVWRGRKTTLDCIGGLNFSAFKSPGFSTELVFGKITTFVVKRLRISSEMFRISSLGCINVYFQSRKRPYCDRRWTHLSCPSFISTLDHGNTLQCSLRGGHAPKSNSLHFWPKRYPFRIPSIKPAYLYLGFLKLPSKTKK